MDNKNPVLSLGAERDGVAEGFLHRALRGERTGPVRTPLPSREGVCVRERKGAGLLASRQPRSPSRGSSPSGY